MLLTLIYAWKGCILRKANQIKKGKTNENLIVKNLLQVFNRPLELLRQVGGFSLLLFFGEGLHYCFFEVFFCSV